MSRVSNLVVPPDNWRNWSEFRFDGKSVKSESSPSPITSPPGGQPDGVAAVVPVAELHGCLTRIAHAFTHAAAVRAAPMKRSLNAGGVAATQEDLERESAAAVDFITSQLVVLQQQLHARRRRQALVQRALELHKSVEDRKRMCQAAATEVLQAKQSLALAINDEEEP
jgi:hypothetical protein